jgi:hypothetical protein
MAHDPRLGYLRYGRVDLVRYLERVDVSQTPWMEYTLASGGSRHALVKRGPHSPGVRSPQRKGITVTLR